MPQSPKKNRCIYVVKTQKDCSGIKCFNCLTIYSTDFGILEMGIPREVGYA